MILITLHHSIQLSINVVYVSDCNNNRDVIVIIKEITVYYVKRIFLLKRRLLIFFPSDRARTQYSPYWKCSSLCLLGILPMEKSSVVYLIHFPYYIASHKHYITIIEVVEVNVSILVYLLFHKEHKYEVLIFESEGHTNGLINKWMEYKF